jgi:hypothetical protein
MKGAQAMKERPDHHDAELMIRVYELRREEVMRESRRAIVFDFWPKSYEDVAAIAKREHPLNAAWRQVGSYWEMVYGMVKHGIVHPGYFLESNGEGLFLFAKIAAYLEQYRKDFNPASFQNAEWVANECPDGRRIYEGTSARVRKLMQSR